jgi:hypothetical protein
MSAHTLDFKNLGDVDQIPAARSSYKYYVFQTHSAHSGVIEPRLYCNNVSCFQDGVISTVDSRRFVDIEAKSMACSVKKSLHSAADHSR